MSQKVIDVSEHNGVVDWSKVKAAGYHAIIRLGYGQEIPSQRDKQAERNVSECERLGIPYGLYLYSYADTEAKASGEAKHAINFVKKFCKQNLKYPVFYDVEETKLARYAKAHSLIFCKQVAAAGITAGVYASESWWLSYLQNFTINYKRWVAKWSDRSPSVSNISLWQYTDRGSVPGVKGNCDVSYSYMNNVVGTPTNGQSANAIDLAHMVLAGEYGNGDMRKKQLGNDYERVQALVNYLTDPNRYKARVVDLVLAGKYGNGEVRKANLGECYDPIQKAVNARLR